MNKFFDLIINDPMLIYIVAGIILLFLIMISISAYINSPEEDTKYVGGSLAPSFLTLVILIFIVFYQMSE